MYLINLCYCCAGACNSKMYLRSEPKRKPLTKCIRLTMRKKAVHFSLCRNADLSKCSASVPHLRFISIAPFHIPTHAYTTQCTQYRHTQKHIQTYIHFFIQPHHQLLSLFYYTVAIQMERAFSFLL